MDLEEDLLARVMAAEDVGLLGIGNHVYGNMVRRYRVFVEVAVITASPSCKWTQKTDSLQQQQKWESSTCDMDVFWL